MKTIQQTTAWAGANRLGKPFKYLLAHQQISVLLEEFGDRHLHRGKSVGFGTIRARNYIAHQLVNDLRAAGFEIRNLLNLDQRHIRALALAWEAEGHAASTLQGRFTVLRWLSKALGKPGLVQDPTYYGVAPESIARVYVAQSDKSWSAKGIIAREKIEQARLEDAWVAAQLDLMSAFGLRIREAVMIQPEVSHQGDTLCIESGTKGGRMRNIAVRTDEQRAALENAKSLAATTARGSLCPPGKTVLQAIRRVYYVVTEKLGISKGQLGLTPHGLRHEYANDRYEEISGNPSAVRGGTSIVDRVLDEAARHQISSDLGHSRLAITAAYTGPRTRGRPKAVRQPGRAGSDKTLL